MRKHGGGSHATRWAAAIVVAALLAGRGAAAQDAARAAPVAQPAAGPRWMVPHVVRGQGGAPQLVSVGVGAMRVVRRAGDGSMYAGPVALLEPGLRAGKVQVGWGRTGPFANGWSVTAAYLRAWGGRGSRWTDGGRDHVGVEVAGSLMFLVGSAGVYRPAAGGPTRVALGGGLTL